MNGIYFQYGLVFTQFKISGGSDIPVWPTEFWSDIIRKHDFIIFTLRQSQHLILSQEDPWIET